jgi:hypothetical protein
MDSETLPWKVFRYKYINAKYPANFNSRSEYIQYFKGTYPLEYKKYRDYANYTKQQTVKNYTPEQKEEQRLKQAKRAAINYKRHKEKYQAYYKEYIKNPINREKNMKRSKEWYWNKRKAHIKVKDCDYIKEIKKELKKKKVSKELETVQSIAEQERKSAIKIEKLSSPITIDFP